VKFKATILVGAAALLAVAAVAIQDAVKVEWKPVVGSKSKIKLDVSAQFDMGGQKSDMLFGMIQTYEIKSVEGDKVTLETKSSNMTLSVGGQDMSAMMGDMNFNSTIVQSKSGEVISVKTDAPSNEGQARLENAYMFIYPNKEMKVGDTWSHKVKGDSAKGTVNGEYAFKLEGTETIDKWKTNKVSYTYKELSGDAPVNASGTVWISADDGNPIKGEYKMKNVVFDPSMPPTDATAKIKRIE